MSAATLRAATAAELTKFLRARVVATTTAMLVVGIALLCSSMLLAVRHGDARTSAKMGALVEPGGWVGYLATGSQITAVAGLLGFGVVLSWLMGREFAQGTVSGLFALPVSRDTLAAAKLLVYAGWVVTVSVALTATLVLLGFAFGLGGFDAAAAPLVLRQLLVALLTGLLALPAAWVATLGRGLLPGIAAIVVVVVVAQVAAIAGAGGWFPFATVGLWATDTGTALFAHTAPAQLALVLPVAAAFSLLTTTAWKRLQLDR
jgi:ABC-2 type transport system permease protein